MKISVIIGTYNQKESLKLVLDSYSRQTLPADQFELILVDSSSTDGTNQLVKSFKAPYQLKYLCLENRGKSYARNQGVKQAQAETILLTDADMIADPNLLARHVELQEKHGNICVEGTTYNFKDQIRLRRTKIKTNPNFQFPKNQIEPYIKQKLKSGQKLKWAYFLSGNLSLRKNTFEQVGSFDENFKKYGWEDIELGYRLNKMKVPLIYAPEAINYHYHFVTGQDMLKRKYNMGKSAAYFYKKHPNLEVKMFLGLNPLAMAIFYLLKTFPGLLKLIKNQYVLEEYNYRLGLTEELKN